MKRFVILASERTGSTMLCQSLDMQQKVRCFGELFNRVETAPTWLKRDYDAGLNKQYLGSAYRRKHWNQFIQELSEPYLSDYRWFGFKLMLTQHNDVLNGIMNDSDWEIVRLYRKNLLAVYGASKVAKATGQAHVLRGQTKLTARVKFDPQEFAQYIDNYRKVSDRVTEQLFDCGRSFMTIEYLDFSGNQAIAKTFRYLGLKMPTRFTPPLEKRHGWNILERFENPLDVEQFLNQRNLQDWAEERPIA